MEHERLLKPSGTPTEWKLYTRRWWILFNFSLLALEQGMVWITFSPLADPAKEYYGVNNFAINMWVALGMIFYTPMVFVTTYMMEKKGLRFTVVFGIVGVAISTLLRLLVRGSDYIWIIYVAQSVNACMGPVALSLPPRVSAVWFGPEERATSTAISTLANWAGSAVGFLLGLAIRHESQIPLLMYAHAGIVSLTALSILLYFPEKPPTPPAASSEVSEAEKSASSRNLNAQRRIGRDLKELFTNPAFLIVMTVGGMSSGLFGTWTALFDVLLNPLNFSQSDAAWFGFGSIVGGITGGLIVGLLLKTFDLYQFGKIADMWPQHLKLLSVTSFVLSTLSLLWFTFQVEGYVYSNFWLVMVSIGITGACFVGVSPLFLELAVELTYPVPESTSGAMITLMNNLAGLAFVLVADFVSPHVINWINCFASLAFVLVLLFVKEEYRRIKIDATNRQREVNHTS